MVQGILQRKRLRARDSHTSQSCLLLEILYLGSSNGKMDFFADERKQEALIVGYQDAPIGLERQPIISYKPNHVMTIKVGMPLILSR